LPARRPGHRAALPDLEGAPGGNKMNQAPILVCFALKEEAKFLRNTPHRILITGMGQKNAAQSLTRELEKLQPGLALTCGFAGALNPKLKLGDIVFDEDAQCGLAEKLKRLGAVPGRFHCSARIAVTVREKNALWQSTGADAVEMESLVMRNICREYKIPSATVRVISDLSNEDLPLDFNTVATPDLQLDFTKLILKILRHPQSIPHLLRFQKQTAAAAHKLAETLQQLLASR
jgi:adenosylhomocysteine nucleosidase